jgi:hypothetical protein
VPAVTVGRVAWRGGPRPDDAMVAARLADVKAALAADGRWTVDEVAVPPRLLSYYPPFAPRWQQLHALEVGVAAAGPAAAAAAAAAAAGRSGGTASYFSESSGFRSVVPGQGGDGGA